MDARTATSHRSAWLAASSLLAIASAGTWYAVSTAAPSEGKGKGKKKQTAKPTHEETVEIKRPGIVDGVAGLIGNTPLMRIASLSELTGCEILGKAEFLNPAGSPKDRVALQILLDAEQAGLIAPHQGDCVFEGTVGSTGISLATLCRAKGYRCSIVLPDDVAVEKSQLLERLGAEVKKVRPRGIVDPRHFVNEARAQAKAFGGGGGATNPGHVVETDGSATTVSIRGDHRGPRLPRGFFADQFETPSNFLAHFTGTGPEIWAQCGGTGTTPAHLDAFIAGAGTGGTLSGVAAALRNREASVIKHREASPAALSSSGQSSWLGWLRRRATLQVDEDLSTPSTPSRPPVRMVLADPQGSGLFNKIHHGVMYSHTEQEGKRRRHQVDSVVEGIGMNRVTRNLTFGVDLVDDAISVTDEEAVRMSRWLSFNDGLFVGSSSAVNVVAAVKTALRMKRERTSSGEENASEEPVTVVTILCDSGSRHLSKFHNDQVLKDQFAIDAPTDGREVNIDDILRG